jgi:hypothetical protein
MNAIDLLEMQHREVEELFTKIEAAEGPEQRKLFLELADNLAAHAAIEEQIFYPQVLVDATEDDLREAVEEHLSIKRVLADLLEMGIGDERFDAAIKVLKEQVEHHVQEEEDEMLPKVEDEIDDNRLEELGAQMEGLFAELITGKPREDVPAETAEPAPLE